MCTYHKICVTIILFIQAGSSMDGPRIFYPLAVESGDFPQLRSVFFTGYALWKACHGQNIRIFAQIAIFA
jgi:hypothetical protein